VIRRFLGLVRAFVGRSLRNRLILLTTLAVGIGAFISSFVVYRVAQESLYNQLDEELISVASGQAPIAAAQIGSGALPAADAFEVENVILMISRANWNSVIPPTTDSTADPARRLVVAEPEIALARLGTGTCKRTGERADGVPYRIVAVPFTATGTADRYVLILGRDLTATNRTLAILKLMQWIAGFIGVAIGAVAGVALARSSLQSIRHLSRGVDQITATDHLHAVAVEGNDEVAHLGHSFNSLVSSLAVSRERQRRLIADASHELRTPLTSLRTNVELLVADEASGMLPPGARNDILRDIAEQLGEFTALIGDLVALSREEGLPPVNLAVIDFRDVVERAGARAQRRGPGHD
jgi:two-component system sensor histidine kinase MprB